MTIRSRSGVLYAFRSDSPERRLRVYPSGEKSIMVQLTMPRISGMEKELEREDAEALHEWLGEWLTDGSRKR